MLADGVHPDEVWELGVADRDVARDALGVAVAGPAAEDGGHVQHNVLAVLVEGGEGWDAWCGGRLARCLDEGLCVIWWWIE